MDDDALLWLGAAAAVALFLWSRSSATGGAGLDTTTTGGAGLNTTTTGATTAPAAGGASPIAQIVAQIESGGGANVANQPASMANPTYGQYPAFVAQYGSGAAGVQNYAEQMLAANPAATLGDFYAGYALNTGNPAAPPPLSQLQAQQPGYYNNLVNNAGYPVNTPLASLV